MIKIVHDELVELLGSGDARSLSRSEPPTVIVLAGLQGVRQDDDRGQARAPPLQGTAGPGSSPRHLASGGDRPAGDARQAARDAGPRADRDKVERLAERGIARAREERRNVVIVDTAGRLHIDDEMMAELERVFAAAEPDEALLVADGMTGQDAVRIAETFHGRLPLTGVILTKLDGDARGGAALSIHAVTGLPIKYVGVGERLDALEAFHPDRMAGRILDTRRRRIAGRARAGGDRPRREPRSSKTRSRRGQFDLDDFLTAMKQLKRMGPSRGSSACFPASESSSRARRSIQTA